MFNYYITGFVEAVSVNVILAAFVENPSYLKQGVAKVIGFCQDVGIKQEMTL